MKLFYQGTFLKKLERSINDPYISYVKGEEF